MKKFKFILILPILIFLVSLHLFAETDKVRNINHSNSRFQKVFNQPITQTTSCHAFTKEFEKNLNLESQLENSFFSIINPKNGISTSSQETEKKFVEFLHFHSHCLLKNIQLGRNINRINYGSLKILLSRSLKSMKLSSIHKEIIFLYADYLINNSRHLVSVYPLRFQWIPGQSENNTYIKLDDVLVTPGLESMWNHCQKRFSWQYSGWKAVLLSGYQSPSFQFLKFVKSSKILQDSLKKEAPPHFSGHHLKTPDIKVELKALTGEEESSLPWENFYNTCKEFGLSPRYPNQNGFQGELKFEGITELYKPIFSNTLIPRGVARNFEAALYETKFFPSPRGLRIIMALSAQESTVQWNPKLNKPKKRTLEKRFNRVLQKLKSSFPGTISNLLLSEEHQKELDGLISELNRITDPDNEKIREFDFYLWSRKTNQFLQKLMEEYSQLLTVGQWFFDVRSLKEQLQHEPQTFGLWQINVNHLQEKMKSFSQLKRIFPEVYQKNNTNWQIDRDQLIKALSGRPDSPLTKKETLELIIYTHLRPRYENHHQGDENDLVYFIAENMAGEMSTFRSAIQYELNKNMKSHLIIDGDLTFYYPYSTRIDWRRKSNTIKKLEAYIAKHNYYFENPVDKQKLIKNLCEARSWDDLKSLELYRKIVRTKSLIRKLPEIRSSLYEQTPSLYAKTVLRKSRLF